MDSNNSSQRDMKTQQNKFWLQTQVNDILEPMMLATCHANPENKITFMLKYLEDMYGDRATRGDRTALANIQSEVLRLEGLVEAQKEKTRDNTAEEREEERGSEDETDEDVSIFGILILTVVILYRMRTIT